MIDSTSAEHTPSAVPRLAAVGVKKQFLGVQALQGVDFSVGPAEIVAVVGENGAGKSTLMKILAGVQPPDVGQIRIEGQPVQLRSVEEALTNGIALIHQELNLSDNLDVAANIFLGREPQTWGWIHQDRMHRDAGEALQRVGLDVDPATPLKDLPIGQQQLVEIAKALSTQAKVLIMDEPTSSLSHRETERLMEVIEQLRETGVSIVYISHRLAEVERLADRVIVLRDGANAGELNRNQITHDAMVSLMVGRDVSRFYQRSSHQPGEVLLEVTNLTTTAWPRQKNQISLRRGEIVGLAGLVGAGRSEFLRAIFGVDEPINGQVKIAGQIIPAGDVRAAIGAGLALVPEDRKQQGLILEMSIRENASLASLKTHAQARVFVNRGYEQNLCQSYRESLGIRMAGAEQQVGDLSGGNQQKVVLARWLATHPVVLLLDEPTRGIDVGAKEEIYRMIDQLAGSGMAILFASSEMEEIIGISDRVLVMRDGRITGELQRNQLTEEAVMKLATQKVH